MSRRELVVVAVAMALLLAGASTFPGRWFETEELRLIPQTDRPASRKPLPRDECAPVGAVFFSEWGGGHLCVCRVFDGPPAFAPAPSWRLVEDTARACPLGPQAVSAWER